MCSERENAPMANCTLFRIAVKGNERAKRAHSFNTRLKHALIIVSSALLMMLDPRLYANLFNAIFKKNHNRHEICGAHRLCMSTHTHPN